MLSHTVYWGPTSDEHVLSRHGFTLCHPHLNETGGRNSDGRKIQAGGRDFGTSMHDGRKNQGGGKQGRASEASDSFSIYKAF